MSTRPACAARASTPPARPSVPTSTTRPRQHASTAAPTAIASSIVYGTFRADFNHFDRIELGLREHTHVRGAAFSCPRLKLADMVLI